jgi:hypothetical protein
MTYSSKVFHVEHDCTALLPFFGAYGEPIPWDSFGRQRDACVAMEAGNLIPQPASSKSYRFYCAAAELAFSQRMCHARATKFD